MSKSQINIRVNDMTRAQIDTLVDKTGMSITELITLAVDRLHNQEIKMKGKYINNGHGKEIDFDAAVELMDDDLREALVNQQDWKSDTAFFQAYAKLHRDKYGEEFEPAKANPTW